MDYFDTHNIFCPQQHGFRSKHSCETQLIGFTQTRANNLDQGQQTEAIAMEFNKAFDKVDHQTFVHKSKHMGVNPYITTWIKDFSCCFLIQALFPEGFPFFSLIAT